MGAFLGKKMGMMPWIKHRHVTYQNEEKKFAIWSIWSDFDDSGYEKSYLIPTKVYDINKK